QAVFLARYFRIPIIFRAIDVTHELVPNRLLIPVTKLMERFIFRMVDFNIALTPHLQKYISSYGVPEERIRLLPSGVDTKMFSPGPRNDAMMRKWGVEPNDPVALFMGTIYTFSGLD